MERYLALCHVMRLCYRLQYELQVVLAHQALQAVLGIHLCTATIVMISATLLCYHTNSLLHMHDSRYVSLCPVP